MAENTKSSDKKLSRVFASVFIENLAENTNLKREKEQSFWK